ncbi:MAG TPA: MarR family transcriptional regulator, partial [Steroidobacteraceae bacterium]|nr:MarR family transcriptional regulator [Steroidobacteraceae bacterium]
MIEVELSPEPVLGLYLHVAYMTIMSTFDRDVGKGEITPNMIGALSVLKQHPGISQADLARMIGIERVTVGVTVSRAVAAGFVRREHASHDARSYALHLTARGQEMLKALRRRIPLHERAFSWRLSAEERIQLRTLLNKLVFG